MNVSYSLFGSDPKYYVGAIKNCEINKILLPEWETIIYYHPEMILMDKVDELKSLGAKVIDVSNIKLGNKPSKDFPYFWRFLSFNNDDITIVRDLDSRISEREVKYINGWLDSGKPYFIIRDHPWHAVVPSGLFGIRGKIESFIKHLDKFIGDSDLRWGTDQDVLYEYMNNIENYDIYYCGFDKKNTYIPRDNKNFFIGIQLDEFDNPTKPSGESCLNYLNELKL